APIRARPPAVSVTTRTSESSGPYLIAFERRFSSTCTTRCRSPWTTSRSSGSSTAISTDRPAASGRISSTASSTSSSNRSGTHWIESCPASIRLMSSTSLISARRSSPPAVTRSAPPRWLGTRRVRPRREEPGVGVQQLLRLVSEQLAQRPVHALHLAVEIEHGHADRRVVERPPELLLCRAEGHLGELPLGDVLRVRV